MRRVGLHLGVCLVLTLVVGCRREPPRPNVLLYVVDTLRADALGAYGGARDTSHALDALARDGVLFERAYAPASWTRPSMAGLLTGRYPDALGVMDRPDRLGAEVETIAERLARAGYTTGAILANPNVAGAFGFDQGWDDFIELYERRRAGHVRDRELIARSDEVTGVARTWIDEASRPFFLLCLTVDPHRPYRPPTIYDRWGGETVRTRTRALYDGEVAFNDASFGWLIEHLDARGELDDTIVVFTSDHGEEFWDHGGVGHGKALWEESIHVPLVIRHPPMFPRGARIAAPVEIIDVAPTLLGLAGLPVPSGLDGRSLAALEPEKAPPVYAALDNDRRRAHAIIVEPWKLIRPVPPASPALFNLADDPGERRNLSAAYPERVRALQALLDERTTRSATARARRAPAAPLEAGPVSERTHRALEALGYLADEPSD